MCPKLDELKRVMLQKPFSILKIKKMCARCHSIHFFFVCEWKLVTLPQLFMLVSAQSWTKHDTRSLNYIFVLCIHIEIWWSYFFVFLFLLYFTILTNIDFLHQKCTKKIQPNLKLKVVLCVCLAHSIGILVFQQHIKIQIC